jgi:hypothetical protein
MDSVFLTRLVTPSPVMHWLLMTLPLTITLSGIFGAAEGESGNRRLALAAALLTVWLFLPFGYGDPQVAAVGQMVSLLGWVFLVWAWARHVWTDRPSPVWVQGLVITHLLAIAIACIVALVRALLASAA